MGGKKKGGKDDPPDRREVLPGSRTPHWACPNCTRANNWACRIVCRCGKEAPSSILNRARDQANKAGKDGGAADSSARGSEARSSSAGLRGIEAQLRELCRRVDKQAAVSDNASGEWTEVHSRHRGKAIAAKPSAEAASAADGDTSSAGQVVPSLQDCKARLKAARDMRATVPDGCPSRAGLDTYISELEKLVEKARTPAARLQAVENVCAKTSAALVVATTNAQEVEALATEVNKRLLAARD